MSVVVQLRPKTFPRVEKIRRRIEAMDYVPCDKTALRKALMAGVRSNEIEDTHRTNEEIALHELFIEKAVPPSLCVGLVQHYLAAYITDSEK